MVDDDDLLVQLRDRSHPKVPAGYTTPTDMPKGWRIVDGLIRKAMKEMFWVYPWLGYSYGSAISRAVSFAIRLGRVAMVSKGC